MENTSIHLIHYCIYDKHQFISHYIISFKKHYFVPQNLSKFFRLLTMESKKPFMQYLCILGFNIFLISCSSRSKLLKKSWLCVLKLFEKHMNDSLPLILLVLMRTCWRWACLPLISLSFFGGILEIVTHNSFSILSLIL